MFRKEDFAEFTISGSIQKIWGITDSLKHNQRARHCFWLPSCKTWCEKYLKEKWKPSCLLNVKLVLKRIDQQDLSYCPGAYVDSEKYMEFLVRVKEITKKIRSRIRLQICRGEGVY